ncbi:hypothetical protein EZL74_10130 [Flavobacterium silvisoli]|uniref:YtkA-like domain-containing protein n=2 Tax=Flavobacterium silvisoli TaxID=2529433 RepID=A0A4Q9Z073_9FLAO|nr:hypothetical protein EZL74_10130 [Flavobacterium silvisoli]
MATAATALLLSLTSCSSSSDSPVVDELANISKFQEMTNDTHVIELYSHLGGLQQGYNEISIRIKDKTTGNYIKNASVTWQPLMHMNMMTHACPYSEVEKVTPSGTLYEGYIVFQMAQNATEYWDLQINYTIDGTDYTAKDVIDVPASTDRRVNSFTGTDGVKYIVAYAEPHHPKVAVNDIIVGIFKMQDMMHFPVADGYSLEIDPRMPSMGNHGSPNNVAATQTAPGELYIGKMSLTMTGYWKINLKLISPEGTVLKGESITDTVTESSLYFDFEF